MEEVSSSVYYTAAMELRNNRRWGLNENIIFQMIKGVKTGDVRPYIRRVSQRNINVVPEYGEWKKTLLIWSVLEDKLQIFKDLYAYGADPFIFDERGYNSIHYCVNLERIEFLEVLANGKTVEEQVKKLGANKPQTTECKVDTGHSHFQVHTRHCQKFDLDTRHSDPPSWALLFCGLIVEWLLPSTARGTQV